MEKKTEKSAPGKSEVSGIRYNPAMRAWASVKKAWPILLSAVVFQLAFPPFNLGLLVFVALAPWLLSLKDIDGKQAVKSGYCFGFLFWLVQFQWVQTLTLRWTGGHALSFVPYLVGPILGGWYFALFAWLAAKAWSRGAVWLIPLLWAGIEIFRSYIPILAFPWGLAAMPLSPFPMLGQLAWFGTVYAVSAWVLLSNVILARILLGEPLLKWRASLMAFVVLAAISVVRFGTPIDGSQKTIVAGQLGVDLAFGDPSKNAMEVRNAVKELYGASNAQKASLLVLPEGVIHAGNSMPPGLPFELLEQPPIVFGGSRGNGPTYQSAFAYDGKWQYADKTRLVVFGEYVPFRNMLPFLDSFQLPSGEFTPGSEVRVLDVGGIKVGPMLCFEGLFYDVAEEEAAKGAQLLAQMSIDDWYMGTPAPEQLKQAVVWRAIETNLPVVRSAALGYTMAVDQRGRVIAEAPLERTFPLHAELKIPDKAEQFPIVRLFPWLFGLSLFWPIVDWLRTRFLGSKLVK